MVSRARAAASTPPKTFSATCAENPAGRSERKKIVINTNLDSVT